MASQKECLFDQLSRTPVDKARAQVGSEIHFWPGTVLAGSTSCRGWTLRARVREAKKTEKENGQATPWTFMKAECMNSLRKYNKSLSKFEKTAWAMPGQHGPA